MKAQGYTKETIYGLAQIPAHFPKFNVGDTIAISQSIKEGDKKRTQVFEGDVIAIHNRGVSSTFIVRKIGAHGVAVERIIPFCSPMIESIEIIKFGEVRRAKLYYIRGRVGRSSRIKEKVVTQEQRDQQAASRVEAK